MKHPTDRRRHMRWRQSAAALAAGALCCVLAACGSSSSSTTPPASSTTSAASTTAAAASGNAQAAAQQVVDGAEAVPTSIPETVPLKSKPPAGKTFVFLECDTVDCTTRSKALATVAKLVGWNYHVLPYQNANPATLVAAMKQALQYKPYAVSLAGLPYALWSSMVPKYKAAGAKIVTVSVGTVPYSQTIPLQIWGPQDLAATGKINADWAIADSGGKANVLLVNLPEFQVVSDYTNSALQTIKTGCSTCKATTLNLGADEVTNPAEVSSAIVSAIRRGNINYVLCGSGNLIDSLGSALSSAGISGVKVGGNSPDIVNLQSLKENGNGAWYSHGYYLEAWQTYDALFRQMEGMGLEKGNDGNPGMLLTQKTVGTPSATVDVPANYASQFEKLWHIS